MAATPTRSRSIGILATTFHRIVRVPRVIALGLVKIYQRGLSPLVPPACKYRPTCSEYCAEAISRYGVLRGGWIGVRRLLRCNPFVRGGFDPVPELGRRPSASRDPVDGCDGSHSGRRTSTPGAADPSNARETHGEPPDRRCTSSS